MWVSRVFYVCDRMCFDLGSFQNHFWGHCIEYCLTDRLYITRESFMIIIYDYHFIIYDRAKRMKFGLRLYVCNTQMALLTSQATSAFRKDLFSL